MSWSALPIELTLRVLSFFDPTELVNLRRVNCFFKSLIDETATLQYHITLFASGMEDGPPGGLITSERLDLLRRYEASWKNLEWSEHNTISEAISSLWHGFYGNVLACSRVRGSESIDFRQFPSRLRGIPMRQWTLKFGFYVQAFGIDLSQDLLVTIESVDNTALIYLLSLSTGEKHPLAENNAVLEYTFAYLVYAVLSVEISGEYVGVSFTLVANIEDQNERARLVVWSWRTGVRKLVLPALQRLFAFLGDNFILGSTLKPPALLVYSLQQPERLADTTTHSNTYLLRILLGNPDIVDIALHSSSSAGWFPSAGLQVPFQIAGDVRIITLNLGFIEKFIENYFRVYVTSLIPTNALLRYIDNLPIKEGHDVDWGLLHGLLLNECIPGRSKLGGGIVNTVGMRYTLHEVVHLSGKPVIIICDICPRRCLRASEEERQESELLYETLMNVSHLPDQFGRRSILKSIPLPENIRYPDRAQVIISDDGIVILEETGRAERLLHLLTI